MCLVFVHHQIPHLIVVNLLGNFQDEKAASKSLLKKVLGVISGVLEAATTEIVELTQWSRQVQVAIFDVLSSNAPSEPVRFVVLSQENVFNLFPGNGARNASTRSHL
jgi:hypothetical protein